MPAKKVNKVAKAELLHASKKGNEAAKAELLRAAQQVLGLNMQFRESQSPVMWTEVLRVLVVTPTNFTIYVGSITFDDGKVVDHACTSSETLRAILKEMDQKYVFYQ